ncbi:hypothetical protein HUT16_34825 [Kitasatospora sp. NA04385]|uniref:hypothetical protein n=1 Tax=Kitasatospora sp. NA04385 TaxID=2742135 RepID=UPI0015909512|nr:hypothetical protein [Kitasatospora sp. NA04385]QKW23584.1 hypothetical protein HUT16_34825 [Kitasatospora sp. NA04385]
MEITVQWVRTSWTKRSRGGAAAVRRNAAPEGFVLPPDAPGPGHLHTVRMREEDDFAPREAWEPLRRSGLDLGLRERDGRLRVLPGILPLYGLPPRPRRPPAVRLLPGQWVRWQLNFRFSSSAGAQDWSYWLDTFNVAYGPVDAGVFRAEPTVLVDERGPVR